MQGQYDSVDKDILSFRQVLDVLHIQIVNSMLESGADAKAATAEVGPHSMPYICVMRCMCCKLLSHVHFVCWRS